MKSILKINFHLFLQAILLFISIRSTAQNTDSLWKVWKNEKLHDTIRLSALHDFTCEIIFNDPDSARVLAKIQEDFSTEKNEIKWIANSANLFGASYYYQGEYEKALEYFEKTLKLNKEIGNKIGMGNSYNNIGNIYKNQGELPSALKYYQLSLKIDEELKNKPGISSCKNNIGMIFGMLGEHQKALDHYFECVKLDEELKDTFSLAISLNNIGSTYHEINKPEKALDYFTKSLRYRKLSNDLQGTGFSYDNISIVYLDLNQPDLALKYADSSYSIRLAIDDKRGLALTSLHYGKIFLKKNNFNKTIEWCLKGRKISKEIEALSEERDNCECLHSAYLATGNYREAYRAFYDFIGLRDSLNNIEQNKKLARLEIQSEFDKKAAADSVKNAERKKVQEAEMEAQEAKISVKDAQLEEEETKKYALYGGLTLLLIFGIFMYNRFTVTKKQNRIIAIQKNKVEHQKELIEDKQKEIIDSINYAKRIQNAILAKEEDIKKYFPESFLLYKPKDIVAGDFYFFEFNDTHVFYAAADCTGHGVPGALVSVVCSNALSRCVKEFELTDPGKILDKTRELVLETFRKSGENVKDGMDISLMRMKYDVQNTNRELFWAGANNPLWIVKNNSEIVTEIMADKQPIGSTEQPQPFTTHKISLEKGEAFYLFTDGYADQFGGEKGKKLKASKMKEILLSVKDKSMSDQKEVLNDFFEEWRGNNEQVDDVCVIGIRL